MQDLIDTLITKHGFVKADTGGGCEALVRVRHQFTDVITDVDGSNLPTDKDWLFVTYAGNWQTDEDSSVVDTIDHESSPVHLTQAAEVALGYAVVAIEGEARVPFKSCADASEHYRTFLDDNGYGGDCPRCWLLGRDGERLGYVSYNGRVWDGPTYNREMRPMFSPCGFYGDPQDRPRA